ncbi:MAG TPA: hypothetical protein VJ205_01295, partial [Gammaproteobacteria bacterium]|nr:hypothetical protein [Gammaproteobacteria bacterium]
TPTIESKRDKPTDPKKDPNPGEETPIRSQSMDLQHKSQPSTKSPQEEADNLDLPPAKGSTNHEPDDE